MRLLWLPGVLRAAGLKVHEVSGWKTRGSSSWGPIRGVTCHATAGARNGSTSGEIGVLLNGSPTAPPPIAQLYLARNGDYHVVASGLCFHNLVGWAGPNKGFGNGSLIGIEAGNDNRGEPWPGAQLDAYRRGVAAICRHLNLPASRVAGHYEHQPGSKSDPLGITMTTFRRQVADLIEEDDMPDAADVAKAVWSYRWDKLHQPDQDVNAQYALAFVHKYAVQLLDDVAQVRAAVAGMAGEDVMAGVREELARHRTVMVEQLATALGPALAQELRGVAGEATAQQLEAAVERALSRARLVVDEQPA